MQQNLQDVNEAENINLLVSIFRTIYNSKSASVKTDHLLATLRQNGLNITPQTLRKYLGHIRKELLTGKGFIVSTVHLGYWYTEDKAEMKSYLDQELNRMSNQYSNVQALHQLITQKSGAQPQMQMQFFT